MTDQEVDRGVQRTRQLLYDALIALILEKGFDKITAAVWYVLTKRSADRHAEPDKVAFKYIMWSWKLDDVKRNGMSTRQWARYLLMRLQLGEDLTHFMRGGHRLPIAPAEQLRALLAELQAADRSRSGHNCINTNIPPPKQTPGGGPGECCCSPNWQ